MDRRAFFGILALLAALAPAATDAQSYNSVPIAELITNPAAHADEYVVVEGVVRAAQWTTAVLPGRGQDLVPMFLMSDGSMGIWVVVIGAPHTRGTRAPSASAPPVGTSVRVYGTFRAGTRAIETDRGITLR
jgi:hypothetical protein